MKTKAETRKYAGFFRRVAAALIDVIILVFVPGFVSNNNQTASAIAGILALAYETWMIGMYGATIGKMVMKIRVVSESGKRIDYPTALVRTLSSYLSVAVFCLGILWVIWDIKRQSWHDKIAKTVVVKV